jgi:hypothetical protein
MTDLQVFAIWLFAVGFLGIGGAIGFAIGLRVNCGDLDR